MGLGDVVVAWLLLRGAEVALLQLADDASGDTSFYEGKVASAKFFASYNLPKLTAERTIAVGVDLSIMDLNEDAFGKQIPRLRRSEASLSERPSERASRR